MKDFIIAKNNYLSENMKDYYIEYQNPAKPDFINRLKNMTKQAHIAEHIVQTGWFVLTKYITELTAINLFYRRSKSHPRWLELYSRHGLLLLLFRSI